MKIKIDHHTLIGGASGSGKTTLLQKIINDNLETATTYIIDPKRIDFLNYKNVIKNDIDIIIFFKKIINEMERRYSKIENSKKPETFKKIIIFVDELGDIILGEHKKLITSYLTKISQKSRASNIFLVLATQRPSTKVIPNEIKINMIDRIGLYVPTAIDSRIIIDRKGLETLLMGQYLYKEVIYRLW